MFGCMVGEVILARKGLVTDRADVRLVASVQAGMAIQIGPGGKCTEAKITCEYTMHPFIMFF